MFFLMISTVSVQQQVNLSAEKKREWGAEWLHWGEWRVGERADSTHMKDLPKTLPRLNKVGWFSPITCGSADLEYGLQALTFMDWEKIEKWRDWKLLWDEKILVEGKD